MGSLPCADSVESLPGRIRSQNRTSGEPLKSGKRQEHKFKRWGLESGYLPMGWGLSAREKRVDISREVWSAQTGSK